MFEKLLNSLRTIFVLKSANTLPDPFDTYYDDEAKIFCIGSLPLNIKKEAAGIIKDKLETNDSFDRASLDSLQLSAEGRAVFDEALAQLCFWIGKLVDTKKRQEGNPLYPWQCAVCLVPTMGFNGWATLSYDEKENTALIFMNIGVLVENLDRLHRISAIPGYLDSLKSREATLAPEVPSLQRNGCLVNFSPNPRFRAIATEIAIKACMLAVFHEFAHFICGHVSYVTKTPDQPEETHSPDKESCAMSPEKLRRHMEFDADEMAGTIASIFWRTFDHPAVAPDDMKNAAFLMEVILAALSNNLILGQYPLNELYYSPLWRTQHLLESFFADFCYIDKSRPLDEQEETRESNIQKMFSLQMQLVSELERAYKILRLGEGLSFERFKDETDTLLAQDQHELVRVRTEFRKYSPAKHFTQRRPGQTQYKV